MAKIITFRFEMVSGKVDIFISGVEEFFSYFDFLKVPHTGTFQKFRKDYCPVIALLAEIVVGKYSH